MKSKSIAKTALKPAPAKAATTKAKSAPKATTGKKKLSTAAPAVKAGRPAPVHTVITARIDIGFGNALYVRGEGPGLSWDRGVPLNCMTDDEWTISLPESAQPVIFKFLVNDLTWSAGPDYVTAPGRVIELVPTF